MIPNVKRPKMTRARLRRLKLAYVNAVEKRQAARFREMTAGLFVVPSGLHITANPSAAQRYH